MANCCQALFSEGLLKLIKYDIAAKIAPENESAISRFPNLPNPSASPIY